MPFTVPLPWGARRSPASRAQSSARRGADRAGGRRRPGTGRPGPADRGALLRPGRASQAGAARLPLARRPEYGRIGGTGQRCPFTRRSTHPAPAYAHLYQQRDRAGPFLVVRRPEVVPRRSPRACSPTATTPQPLHRPPRGAGRAAGLNASSTPSWSWSSMASYGPTAVYGHGVRGPLSGGSGTGTAAPRRARPGSRWGRRRDGGGRGRRRGGGLFEGRARRGSGVGLGDYLRGSRGRLIVSTRV